MKKLSLLLAVAMLVSVFSLTAFADGAAKVVVSSTTASAGDTITLTVNVTNSPGITGIQLYVEYDSDVMSYVSAKGASGSFFTSTSTEQGANPVKIVLANLSLKEITGDFVAATVTFKINDNAKPGQHTVSISSVEAYDSDIVAVACATENGSVTVKRATTGTSGTVHKHSYKETVVAANGAEAGYTLYECACGHSYKGNFEYAKFVKSREYIGTFVDVPEKNWYYEYVKLAYEYALANGTSATKFSPDNKFTVAQALTAAVNIHKAYYGTTVRNAATGEKWYDPYVEYCESNQIISKGRFTDMDKNITRGEMAIIFANILPDSEYVEVKSGSNPDVTADMACATAVQKLFKAGIVSGDASTGNYRPNDEILRSEACVIFTRFAAVDKRAK